ARSKHLRIQVSIPSASTSTLRKPSTSISSLFHSILVRSSMRAFMIGHRSDSLFCVMTKPPVCWPSCRGKPMYSPGSSNTFRSVGRSPRIPHFSELIPRLGKPVYRIEGRPHRFANIADGALPVHLCSRGYDPCAVAAIFTVDVLHHLLAPLVFKIHVDIRRFIASVAHKTREQQVKFGGIYGSDTQAVADSRVGGRSAPLTEDVPLASETHQIID